MNTDKGIGMFLGLAIGDALGAVLEFQEPREPENYVRCYQEGGSHNVSIGEWTDNRNIERSFASN